MPEAFNDPELLGRQRASRQAQYDAQLAASRAEDPDSDTTHLAAGAIIACELCDDDGYKATGRVCDHVDRTQTTSRGMAKVMQALNQGKLT